MIRYTNSTSSAQLSAKVKAQNPVQLAGLANILDSTSPHQRKAYGDRIGLPRMLSQDYAKRMSCFCVPTIPAVRGFRRVRSPPRVAQGMSSFFFDEMSCADNVNGGNGGNHHLNDHNANEGDGADQRPRKPSENQPGSGAPTPWLTGTYFSYSD